MWQSLDYFAKVKLAAGDQKLDRPVRDYIKKKDVNPSRPDSGRGEKINLNFYFHTSLWCLERIFEGL